MEIEMKIISREIIKPSIPTPTHLKSYKLSLLDHLFSVCEYRTPSVLFYAGGNPCTLSRLRDSLSITLSLFYPLAGRFAPDASTIDCTDEGAPFFVARANCSLSALLLQTNRIELVGRLLPNHAVDPTRMLTGLVPLILQVTEFDCGGFAIGCQGLHKSFDGTSRTHFFKTWAAFTAGREREVIAPDFTTAISIFPPSGAEGSVLPSAVKVLRPVDDGECVVRAFEFNTASIRALQAKARSESVPYPTRIESVSGFIWKHLFKAAAIAGPSVVIHSVDMRSSLRPPLPPTTFGKFTNHAVCRYDSSALVPSDADLVAILHRAISKAKDPMLVSKYRGERGAEAVHQHKQKLQKLKKESNVNAYTFTSWTGLDVDFGSGMPLWIGFSGGPTSSWFRNFVPLIQTPGYGIEAWLVLDPQEMANLESNSEFLAFATPSFGSTSTSIFAQRSLL